MVFSDAWLGRFTGIFGKYFYIHNCVYIILKVFVLCGIFACSVNIMKDENYVFIL